MSQLEELFGQAANRAGSIENLLDEFFGFLNKRTDFYIEIGASDRNDINQQFKMGFPEGRAEQMVMKSFKKYPFKSYGEAVSQLKNDDLIPKSAASKSKVHAPTHEKSTIENKTPEKQRAFPQTNSSTPVSFDYPQTPPAMTEPKARYTEKGKQIPIGNGGMGDNYFWTQSFREVTICLTVPVAIRTKDVLCRITAKELVIRVAGEELLAGSFEDPINVSESLWTMAHDAAQPFKQVVITLEKTRETWWKSALVGHAEIDTNMVDSTKRIGDFDSSTQATLSKLLWEQREKSKAGQYDPPNELYDALYPSELDGDKR